MHRMSYSSRMGQRFAVEGRRTVNEAKVTGALAMEGDFSVLALPLKRMISISSTRFSLFIPYHLFLSSQCSCRLIYTWVTLVQGSVMCGPGWKCFSTDIKSWIWSRGDFTISRVIFLLYWALLCSQSNVTCVSYCLAKNKQGRKELDFLDYLQTGFGFLGLPTNWFLKHQWGWQLTLPFQLPVFKYVSES